MNVKLYIFHQKNSSNLFFQDNETKAGKMAKNLRCDENVLEEFANGVLRFPQQKLDLPM